MYIIPERFDPPMFVEVTFFSKKDLLILNLDFEKKAVKSMQQKWFCKTPV